ncbi:MAG TPA: hypothetical protein VFT84_05950, partial [Gemmatimonadales bacterium]|nr:hypothetical protein [Gemmatimonadales bacterium]
LTSAQAVELTTQEAEPVDRAMAAADIGAEVLGEVASFWGWARDLAHEGLARLEPEHPPGGPLPDPSVADRLAVEF